MDERKRLKNPFLTMRSMGMDQQAMRDIDDTLKEKKVTPEQASELGKAKEALRLRSRNPYPDERVTSW